MPLVTYEEIWEKEFVPQVAAIRAREAEARTYAFLSISITLCGEEVRQMTPADMLHLDALGNPFIAGSADGSLQFVDVAGFLWQLHVENDQTNSLANLWRRGRFLRRLAKRNVAPLVPEIMAFVDRMLLDPSKPAKRAGETRQIETEPKTHFLAPLIVDVSSALGHIDPVGGQLLAHTPLPRILQYRQTILEDKGGAKSYSEIDSLRMKCVDRVNHLNAIARAEAAA